MSLSSKIEHFELGIFKINTPYDASQTVETTRLSTMFGKRNAENAMVPFRSELAVQISARITIFKKDVESGIGAKPNRLALSAYVGRCN